MLMRAMVNVVSLLTVGIAAAEIQWCRDDAFKEGVKGGTHKNDAGKHAFKDADCSRYLFWCIDGSDTNGRQYANTLQNETYRTDVATGLVGNDNRETAGGFRADNGTEISDYADTSEHSYLNQIQTEVKKTMQKIGDDALQDANESPNEYHVAGGTYVHTEGEEKQNFSKWWARLLWSAPQWQRPTERAALTSLRSSTSEKIARRKMRLDTWRVLWGDRLLFNPIRNGHCLYEILAKAVLGNDAQYRRVRHCLANYIQMEADKENMTPSQYRRAVHGLLWGGPLEIKAAAELYQVNIRVVNTKMQTKMIAGPTDCQHLVIGLASDHFVWLLSVVPEGQAEAESFRAAGRITLKSREEVEGMSRSQGATKGKERSRSAGERRSQATSSQLSFSDMLQQRRLAQEESPPKREAPPVPEDVDGVEITQPITGYDIKGKIVTVETTEHYPMLTVDYDSLEQDDPLKAAMTKYETRLNDVVQLGRDHQGWWYPWCTACGKWADLMHINSKKHKQKMLQRAGARTTRARPAAANHGAILEGAQRPEDADRTIYLNRADELDPRNLIEVLVRADVETADNLEMFPLRCIAPPGLDVEDVAYAVARRLRIPMRRLQLSEEGGRAPPVILRHNIRLVATEVPSLSMRTQGTRRSRTPTRRRTGSLTATMPMTAASTQPGDEINPPADMDTPQRPTGPIPSMAPPQVDQQQERRSQPVRITIRLPSIYATPPAAQRERFSIPIGNIADVYMEVERGTTDEDFAGLYWNTLRRQPEAAGAWIDSDDELTALEDIDVEAEWVEIRRGGTRKEGHLLWETTMTAEGIIPVAGIEVGGQKMERVCTDNMHDQAKGFVMTLYQTWSRLHNPNLKGPLVFLIPGRCSIAIQNVAVAKVKTFERDLVYKMPTQSEFIRRMTTLVVVGADSVGVGSDLQNIDMKPKNGWELIFELDARWASADAISHAEADWRTYAETLVTACLGAPLQPRALYAHRQVASGAEGLWSVRLRANNEQARSIMQKSGTSSLFSRPFNSKEQTTTDYGIVWSALHDVPLQQQLTVVQELIGKISHLGLCRSRAGLGARVLWNSIAEARNLLRPGDRRFTKESMHLIDSQNFRVNGLPAGLDHAEIAEGFARLGWKTIPQRRIPAQSKEGEAWCVTSQEAPKHQVMKWNEALVSIEELSAESMAKQRGKVNKTREQAKSKETKSDSKPVEKTAAGSAPQQAAGQDPWANFIMQKNKQQAGKGAAKSVTSSASSSSSQVPILHTDPRIKELEPGEAHGWLGGNSQ